MKSPCVKICKLIDSVCIGCGRTSEQISEWTKYTDEEKKQVIEISRSRMSGWQLEAFDKAYNQKKETGLSPIKQQKLQNEDK